MEIDHVQMVLPEPVSSEGLLLWIHKINGTVRLGNALQLKSKLFISIKIKFLEIRDLEMPSAKKDSMCI